MAGTAVTILEGNTTLSLSQTAWSTIYLSTPSSSSSSYGGVELTTPSSSSSYGGVELTTPSSSSSYGGVEPTTPNSSVSSLGVSPQGTTLAVTSLVLCAIVGLPSNVAVIIAIARKIAGQSTSFTWKLVLTLAVCDLLSLLTIPVWIYGLLRGWSLGEPACKMFVYLVYWTLYASVLTVTSMSVHHHSIIKTPNPKLLERLHVRRQRVWLVGLWVLAALLVLHVIPTRSVVERDGLLRCQTVVASDWQRVACLLYEVLCGYVIPFCVLLSSYWCLHKKVGEGVQSEDAEKKMTRLVVSIVVVFFVCWTPTQVIKIADMVTTLTRVSNPDKYMQIMRIRGFAGDFAKTLSFLNCCLDPFIYAFASKSIFTECLGTLSPGSAHNVSQVTLETCSHVSTSSSAKEAV